MNIQANVEYKYRRIGMSKWSTDTWSGSVRFKTERAVVNELLKKHRHSEVEIVTVQWE